LAGKGRTGTVISCYLLYLGLLANSLEARKYFTATRSRTNWGINSPAQIRYTEYFDELLTSIPIIPVLNLLSIKITPLPIISRKTGQTVISWTIIDYNNASLQNVINQTNFVKYKFNSRAPTLISAIPFNSKIQGDILIVLNCQRTGRVEKLGFLALNTVFLLSKSEQIGENEHRYVVSKSQMDGICTDDRFPNDFNVELRFTTLKLNEISQQLQFEWSEYMALRTKLSPVYCELNQDSSRPLHSGFLIKQGGNVRNLKKRWFVLYPDRLCYFLKPHLWPARGEILLNTILTFYIPIMDTNIPQEMVYPFIISCPGREFLMTADSEKGREDWMKMSTAAKKKIN
jgi:hypothetical protein